MSEAYVSAGRGKSVSARHYTIYEFDRIAGVYM
jgi:hypothetical protein